jgi:AraC-like DNA-binding protein
MTAGEYAASGPDWRWERPGEPTFELYILAGGSGRFSFSGRSYEAIEGDVVLIPPPRTAVIEKTSRANMILRYAHLATGAHSWRSTWESPSEVGDFLSHEASGALRTALFLPEYMRLGPDPELLRMHTRTMEMTTRSDIGCYLELFVATMQMLVYLSGRFLASISAGKGGPTGPALPPPVAKATRFIESHLRDPVSLSTVADALDINADYLGKVFRKAVGSTVGEYILQRKMRLARAYLLSGERTVKQVALELGFSDARYFARVFRRRAGVTPSEYIRTESGR